MRKILILLIVLCAVKSYAVTCLAVSPNGSGAKTGADWNNSLQGIPATLTRGDVYYLADGNYGSYTFNTSGTATVEIRKAQSYDNGSTCSPSIAAGWNVGTMGSGQAIFASYRELVINSSGLILNGNGQQTTPGCGGNVGTDPSLLPGTITDCGILIDNKTACTSTASGGCTDGISDGGVAITSFTMKYVEYRGMGNATSEHYLIRADNSSNFTVLHNYIHYYGAVCVVVGGTSHFTFQNNYVWRNQIVSGTAPGHGQCLEDFGDSGNMNVFANFFRDLGGTAIIMSWVGTGSVQAGPYAFYDNVVWTTPGFTPAFPSANGILACINGFTCNNVTMSQNTIALMGSAQAAIDSETGGTYLVQNNLWYSSTSNGNLNPHGTFTQDHNSYLASGTSCPTGTANVCDNVASNPFNNSTSGDFSLSSDTADVNNRASLAAPINVDILGVTFSTDRGAYQFTGGPVQASSPTFSPIAGTYTGTQSVTISTTSTGAIICYNTTGSPATNGGTGCAAASTLYTGPVSVAVSETIFAVAGGTGFLDSNVASAAYVIKIQAVAPTFFPGAGTYIGQQSVQITTPTGSVICYATVNTPPVATNGTTGCTTGTLYSGPVIVPVGSETLYAVAGGTGYTDSTVASAAYLVHPVELWSTILDWSRAVDWTKAGIPGGIPIRTTISAVLGPSGDTTGATDATNIETQLKACVNNGIVLLNAGTYYFNAGLFIGNRTNSTPASNCTLRGAGPDSTIFKFISPGLVGCGNQTDICIEGGTGNIGNYTGQALWTGDNGGTGTYTKGDNIISIGAWTGNAPVVGSMIMLDQRNDSIGVIPKPPVGPTVTAITTGSTTYTYEVSATVPLGTLLLGATTTITNGAVTPNNTIVTPSVGTSTGCTVYETAPSTLVFPTVNCGQTVTDTGQGVSGSAPAGTIAGATESGTTVTLTTTLPHSFTVGQCIGVGNIGSSESTTAYNSAGNTSSNCTGTGGTWTGWFSITGIGCNVNGVYSASGSCGVNPINALQYTAASSGLAASGSTGLGVQSNITADTGGVFVSDVYGATLGDVGTIGRPCPSTNIGPGGGIECATGEISLRSQEEVKVITGCNGSTVAGTSCAGAATLTIDPPIEESNWRTSQNPGVYWMGTPAVNIGLENFTYDMTNDQVNSSWTGIHIANAYQCWVKNVRGINANRNHVWLVATMRDDVLDSYFFGTKGGGATSYGVEANTTSDNLIQNNICQHIPACIMSAVASGNVFGYNYAVDSGDSNPVNFLYAMVSENHDFARMNLYEGNDSPAIVLDDTHGNGSLETTFRGRMVGQDFPVKNANSLMAVFMRAFNRATNLVGNVLGSVAAETAGYQSATVPTPQQYIYDTGQIRLIGSGGAAADGSLDSLLRSSMLRWGNYDVFSAAVRWCGNSSNPGWSTTCSSTSEIPTTGVTFVGGNAVPANLTLPPSFYLNTQPAFWTTTYGTPMFPAIGPDVAASGALDATCTINGANNTSCDGVNHMSFQIPAQICYNNSSPDAAYQQSFSVTAGSITSGTATITIGANTLAAGNTITVTGVTPTAYNGTYQVTSATSTTVSYLVTGTGTYVSGGTVTWPNILLYSGAFCYPTSYPPPAPAPSAVFFTKLQEGPR